MGTTGSDEVGLKRFGAHPFLRIPRGSTRTVTGQDATLPFGPVTKVSTG